MSLYFKLLVLLLTSFIVNTISYDEDNPQIKNNTTNDRIVDIWDVSSIDDEKNPTTDKKDEETDQSHNEDGWNDYTEITADFLEDTKHDGDTKLDRDQTANKTTIDRPAIRPNNIPFFSIGESHNEDGWNDYTEVTAGFLENTKHDGDTKLFGDQKANKTTIVEPAIWPNNLAIYSIDKAFGKSDNEDGWDDYTEIADGDQEANKTTIDEPAIWPNNLVFYSIDKAFDTQHNNEILRVMRIIEHVSCITFKEVPLEHANYLYIVANGMGCHSELGFKHGIQKLNLQKGEIGKGCFGFETILEQLLKTIGLDHIHRKDNRPNHVKVTWGNPATTFEADYENIAHRTDSKKNIHFGSTSVFQLSSQASSDKNNLTSGTVQMDKNQEIGQQYEMSLLDIDKLNRMYNCSHHG